MSPAMPEEGTKAPGFSVTAHDGSTVSLEGFLGRKHVLLYFFPKADTPG